MSLLAAVESGIQSTDVNAFPNSPFHPFVVVVEDGDVFFSENMSGFDGVLPY